MATETDNALILKNGAARTIGTADILKVTGGISTANEVKGGSLAITTNAVIGGDLQVQGSTITTNAEHVVTGDSVFELNNGYLNTGTIKAAGYAATMLAATGGGTGDTITGAVFVAGTTGVGAADAQFSVAGANFAGILKKGDIFQLSSLTAFPGNNGMFVCAADPGINAGDPVKICSTVTALPANAVWCQNQFDAGTETSVDAVIVRGTVVAQLASDGVVHDLAGGVIPAGSFCTAYAANAAVKVGGAAVPVSRTEFAFSLVESATTLQDAYDLGADVTVGAGRPIQFLCNATGNAGFEVLGQADGDGIVRLGTAGKSLHQLVMYNQGAASGWTSVGQDLTIATDTTGTLALTSAGILDLNAGAAFTVDGADTSHVIMDANADAAKALDIEAHNANAGGSAKAHLNFLADDNITAGSIGFDVNASGAITMDGGANSNLSVANDDITLTLGVAGGGTSQLIASSAGAGTDAIRLLASAGGIDVDAEGTLTLNSKAASNFTMTANVAADRALVIAATNTDAGGDGILDLDGDIITIDSGVGAVSIDAAAGANLTATTGTLTVKSTAGALTQTAALSSTWGMSANTGSPQTLNIEAGNADAGAANVGHLYLKSYDGDVTVEAEEGVVLLKTGHLANGTAGVKDQARVMMLSGAGAVIYADNTTISGNDAVGVMCDDSGGNAGDPCLMLMQQGTIAEVQMKAATSAVAGARLYLDTDGLCVTQSTVASGSTVVLVGVAVEAFASATPGSKGLCVWNGRAIAQIP